MTTSPMLSAYTDTLLFAPETGLLIIIKTQVAVVSGVGYHFQKNKPLFRAISLLCDLYDQNDSVRTKCALLFDSSSSSSENSTIQITTTEKTKADASNTHFNSILENVKRHEELCLGLAEGAKWLDLKL